MNPHFHTDFSISDSLIFVRKSVLIYETIIVPGILQVVICPGKVQKRNMYIPTSQPAMPMQVRQDLQDVSMKTW